MWCLVGINVINGATDSGTSSASLIVGTRDHVDNCDYQSQARDNTMKVFQNQYNYILNKHSESDFKDHGELMRQEDVVKVIMKAKMTTIIAIKDARREPKILRVDNLVQFYEAHRDHDNVYVVMELCEGGDSWFNCLKLELPQGCGYEFQMSYGSIGWSVGATLGYAQAAQDKRMIACIGDDNFQVTAQDVSTMLRCGQKTIIFLINNGGYTTEVEIHDGPYNVVKNWNYTGLVDAIHNGEGKCWATKIRYEKLLEAIEIATGAKKDCLCFIEHNVVGIRFWTNSNVSLKNTLMLGAGYYEMAGYYIKDGCGFMVNECIPGRTIFHSLYLVPQIHLLDEFKLITDTCCEKWGMGKFGEHVTTITMFDPQLKIAILLIGLQFWGKGPPNFSVSGKHVFATMSFGSNFYILKLLIDLYGGVGSDENAKVQVHSVYEIDIRRAYLNHGVVAYTEDAQGDVLLLIIMDKIFQQGKVWLLQMGTNISSESCLLHEEDAILTLHFEVFESKNYILVASLNKVTMLIFYLYISRLEKGLMISPPSLDGTDDTYTSHCGHHFFTLRTR